MLSSPITSLTGSDGADCLGNMSAHLLVYSWHDAPSEFGSGVFVALKPADGILAGNEGLSGKGERMNRDVVTTVGGLILVGIVVVATFLYGNQQRQTQLRHDQAVQRQQQTTKTTPKPSPAPAASSATSSSSGTSSTPAQQPAVQKPSASNQTALQGGSQSSNTTATTPAAQTSPPTETPDTGSSPLPAAAATVLLVMAGVYWRSRQALRQAAIRA